MFLMDFLKRHNACTHERVSLNTQFNYCPDCGELIENEWFLARCACCGIKQKAIIRNGEIMPESNFCRNCGGNEYTVEKLDSINFIDINYAVLVKTVIDGDRVEELTQCWEERPACTPKLLQVYR